MHMIQVEWIRKTKPFTGRIEDIVPSQLANRIHLDPVEIQGLLRLHCLRIFSGNEMRSGKAAPESQDNAPNSSVESGPYAFFPPE